MLEWFVYFMEYLGAGLFLKAGDDLLDETKSHNLAWFPLAISGLLFGVIMATSEWDLILLTSVVLGVGASGKVNRVQFSIGFLLMFCVLFILGIPTITAPLDLAAILIMLFLAAVLDEKGSDWADRAVSPRVYSFFDNRFSLRILVLLVSIPWPMFLPSAIGLWFFDLGYAVAAYMARGTIIQEPDRQDYNRRP